MKKAETVNTFKFSSVVAVGCRKKILSPIWLRIAEKLSLKKYGMTVWDLAQTLL